MNVNAVARIAWLVGEPARTAMLLRLMDGRAMTARELVRVAGISPATGSRHLAMMVEAGLLQVTAIGRHRYHRIGSVQIARLLENLLQVAGVDAQSGAGRMTGPKDESLRRARTCYDHVAGRLGVAIANQLADDEAIVVEAESAWLSDRAAASLGRLGVTAPEPTGHPRRALCRPCMDWSERRIHLAGRLGAAICEQCMAHGWLRRKPESRALDITPRGQVALRNWMGLDLWRSVVA